MNGSDRFKLPITSREANDVAAARARVMQNALEKEQEEQDNEQFYELVEYEQKDETEKPKKVRQKRKREKT